jgi:uncharacterized protein (TIGR02466 family)
MVLKMEYDIIPLFSTPYYKSTVDITADIVEYLIHKEYTLIPDNSGYYTKDSYVLNSLPLAKLKNSIEQHINTFMYDVLKVPTNLEFYITNSWCNIHEEGHYASLHNHTNSLFSGTCYINIPEDDESVFKMLSNNDYRLFPSVLYPDLTEYNILNCNSWSIKPETGTLILFSSQIEHEATPMTSKTDHRICLAFNIFMRGKLGGKISSVELK